nr:protein mono-ADP-ribosyltransferase PARP16 isoform X2 [Equus asinus]
MGRGGGGTLRTRRTRRTRLGLHKPQRGGGGSGEGRALGRAGRSAERRRERGGREGAPPQAWESGLLWPIVPGASPAPTALTLTGACSPATRGDPGCSPRAGRPSERRRAATCWPPTSGAASSPRPCRATSATRCCGPSPRPMPATTARTLRPWDVEDFEEQRGGKWYSRRSSRMGRKPGARQEGQVCTVGACHGEQEELADASKLPNLKELLQSSGDREKRAWDLVSWILSSKVLTIHSAGKSEFEKIQKLTGTSHMPVPVPDFLFEIEYSDPANAKFYETKGERDLIYAFHGSRLENFHSIIHNGLHCHLNKTSLFGEGTYLTSDLSLALIYSPHGHGWQRSLLGPILSCVAVCEVIDHPDVKCQTKKKDSKELDRRRARIKHSEGGDIPPKYFVVTNNQLLRVKYLLVYSQKQPKRASSQLSWVSSHWFTVMISLYLLLLLLVSVINSSAFQHFWNRVKR